jgi:hypothetical protein
LHAGKIGKIRAEEMTMAQAELILTCSLTGACDSAAAQALLEQYGLHSRDTDGDDLEARGKVPVVFKSMQTFDIEAHLAARIEDAVPGTRVAHIKATLVQS